MGYENSCSMPLYICETLRIAHCHPPSMVYETRRPEISIGNSQTLSSLDAFTLPLFTYLFSSILVLVLGPRPPVERPRHEATVVHPSITTRLRRESALHCNGCRRSCCSEKESSVNITSSEYGILVFGVRIAHLRTSFTRDMRCSQCGMQFDSSRMGKVTWVSADFLRCHH
jgi:hypothetical protein